MVPMMDTGRYVSLDENEVKRLIRDNPWGTIVTDTAKGLIASHYPMLLENDGRRKRMPAASAS